MTQLIYLEIASVLAKPMVGTAAPIGESIAHIHQSVQSQRIAFLKGRRCQEIADTFQSNIRR